MTTFHDHGRFLAMLLAAMLAVRGLAFGQGLPPRPAIPPPVAASLPAAAVKTLPNGLRVVVIERRSAPLVSVNALVMSGAECDPPREAGMAEMVAGLLPQGTEKRTAMELAQLVDQAGGTIDSGADWDKSLVSVSVLSKQRRLAFDALSDILIRPAFRPQGIERFRRQTISALQVLWQDPGYVADAAIRRLAFDGTPYGHPADGTVASNSRITRDDIVKFHREYYRPNNTILAVLGDISTKQAFKLAVKYFGNWQGGEIPARPAAQAEPMMPADSILVIDKPDAVQTEIRVGNPGIPRASPAFVPLTVANEILGGPAANRLFQALRTERGLVYGASSHLDCYRDAGAWIAKTSTRTPETDEALAIMLKQIERLRSRHVNSYELAMARNYLTGHQALEFESMNGIAAHTLGLMLYGLPLDYWNRFPQEIAQLDSGKIESAVKHYLHPKNDAIVLVGNSAEFLKGVRKFGRVTVISIDRLDLESPTLEREAASAPVPGD